MALVFCAAMAAGKQQAARAKVKYFSIFYNRFVSAKIGRVVQEGGPFTSFSEKRT